MKKKVSKPIAKRQKTAPKKTPVKAAKKMAAAPARKSAKKFNKKELAEFKKILLVVKEKILEGMDHISTDILKKSPKEASGDISGYSFHMADVATDTYDREFSLSLASNDRELLYELSDALKKIEEGTFGSCEDCKTPITKVRLRAVPYARLCVKCQEKREKR